jgi:putative copper resistance protein D
VSLQLAVRFVHLLAVVTWVGGMLFIALVLVPVTRRLADPALRTRLVQDTGRRFRAVGWVALGLIVATGLGNLVLRPELLWAPRFHVKLGLVGLALGLAALHDFVLGPRAGRPDAAPTARVRASWVARVNVLVALAIVALGLALRG